MNMYGRAHLLSIFLLFQIITSEEGTRKNRIQGPNHYSLPQIISWVLNSNGKSDTSQSNLIYLSFFWICTALV